MGIVFKNNAKTTLASSLSNSATSATVTDGSVFPSLSAGEFFLITFDDGTNNEICKCTARSGNTLTIVRAQESTTARAFSSGDAAEGRVTAGVLEQIQENIAAKSANQTVFNTTTSGGATTYDIGTNPGVEANAMVFLNGVLQHHDTLSFSGSNLTFDAAPPDGMALEVIIDNLINLQSSNLTVDSFTAADVSGSPQTDFTLSDTPAAETNLIVFVDGVFQDQDAYTISSNTLTITTGVIAGRGVTVYVINPVNIGTPSDSTVTSAKLSGNITMPGTLTVGSNDVAFDSPTFVVDHTNSRVGLGTASPSVPVDIVGEVKTSTHINIGGNLVKASGNLTIDVAGDITLDADGADVLFKDGGTQYGRIGKGGGSDLIINASIADKDIFFSGTDGSTSINALVLDMSDAGQAIFNSGASFEDGKLTINEFTSPSAFTQIRKTNTGSNLAIVSQESIYMLLDENNDQTNRAFFVEHGAGSPGTGTTLFKVQENGRVGIGTGDPRYDLNVVGNNATAIGIGVDNTSGSSTLDIAALGAGYASHQAGAGEVWFYSPDNINIGGATGNQNDVKFIANNSVNMRIKGDTGNVGIDNNAPAALLQVGGDGITVNTYLDRSRTAIFRTTGSGNYSTSGNNSAAHAASFMRGTNAATGDQVGHSYVFDDGNWSATAEIMAEVENASNAYSRLNFKTWSGSMLTRQYITSDGQVVKPYQSAFVAVRNSTQSIAINQNVIFNQTYKNVGSDFNTTNGVYTAPFSGFYFFSYTLLLQSVSTAFHVDHYLRTSNHSFIGGMPGRIEYQAGISWGDGYLGMGHAQIAYMDAGDIAYVNFSELGGATRSLYGNTGNNWTKFTGYFLG